MRVIVLAILIFLDVECIQSNCQSILLKLLQKSKREEDTVSDTVCVYYSVLSLLSPINPPFNLSSSSPLLSPPLLSLPPLPPLPSHSLPPSSPLLSPPSSPLPPLPSPLPSLPIHPSPRRLYL